MRQIPFMILLATLCVGLTGCRSRQETTVSPPVTATDSNPVTFCGTELSRGMPPFKDPLLSLKASVQADCLRLTAGYSGGCQEHDFDLYWDGEWDRTKPPVAHLFLSHHAHGDACEAIKAQKVGFILQQIRFPGNGQVIAEIHAEGVPLTRVSYTY